MSNHSVGESSSGKASRSLAQHIPGPGGIEGVKGAASGVVGELARARLALDERGQKLSDLEERTAAMLSSADFPYTILDSLPPHHKPALSI